MNVIIEHFDVLVSQIDIYTEEELEKHSSTTSVTIVEVPNEEDPLRSKSMLVCDYLHARREEMIGRLKEAQSDALTQLECIQNNSKIPLESFDDATLRKLLFRVIRFPVVLQIEKTKQDNPSPFKLYLIKFEFNIDTDERYLPILR